jgi:hypothetical protein
MALNSMTRGRREDRKKKSIKIKTEMTDNL